MNVAVKYIQLGFINLYSCYTTDGLNSCKSCSRDIYLAFFYPYALKSCGRGWRTRGNALLCVNDAYVGVLDYTIVIRFYSRAFSRHFYSEFCSGYFYSSTIGRPVIFCINALGFLRLSKIHRASMFYIFCARSRKFNIAVLRINSVHNLICAVKFGIVVLAAAFYVQVCFFGNGDIAGGKHTARKTV